MRNKIAYLTHMRLPTEKAYGVQMANTIHYLSLEGADVTLFGAECPNLISEDVYSYYNIPQAVFSYEKLPAIRVFRDTRTGFWLNMLSFSLTASFKVFNGNFNVVYSREPFPLLFLSFFSKKFKTVYEMHDFPEKYLWFHKFLCRRASHVVVTNEWARIKSMEIFGLEKEKLLLAPNGYDPKKFTGGISKSVARKKLGFAQDSSIVLYSGHLYEWKGAKVIFKVAKKLTSTQFIFVGGNQQEQEGVSHGEVLPNVQFLGHQKPDKIPMYLAAADLLVLPNIPSTPHSRYSTSPIKLFEYMASRRLVLASELPSVRSLVTDEEVIFVEPGNVLEWETAIQDAVVNHDRYSEKIVRAADRVKKYSWANKARKIINFVNSK